MATLLPTTLGALRASEFTPQRLARSVKDELRENLIAKLRAKEPLFPGIVGYQDTVVPQIVNAVLSRHNFILLGLRGQAKSRILRSLTTLLDPATPYIAGAETRDNPYAPISKFARDLIARMGDETPIAWLTPDDRFVEKLATPDVTVADLVGDIDPIKAARSNQDLGSELTMHYGLLPRANRGIFAINEIPDLAGKIQVALFNIMQEGDVQIKGYPVRLPLDVAIVFSANPEDYTARGKIVTPLKDRIGSEIRTHYPEDIEEGISITAQEAWSTRPASNIEIPHYIRQIIEQIAFAAREDKKVDKRSGVSQRLPISTMELVLSNAERRALIHEMIRTSVASVFDKYFASTNTQQIEQWFNLGGTVQLNDAQPSTGSLAELQQIQGLFEKLSPLKINGKSTPEAAVSAAEFLLEGMTAHKRLSRTEERSFTAAEKKQRTDQAINYAEKMREREIERDEAARNRTRRGFN